MPYFDYAASAPLLPQVLDAMTEAFSVVGNPSAAHSFGRRARQILEEARESIAADLGCAPTEVIFTSGGTEADVLALSGAVAARPGSVIAISAIEHAAVAKYPGERIVLPVRPSGVLDLAAAKELLAQADGRVALSSVMLVNNETGVVQPVAEVAELARSFGAWSHTDAVQGIGSVPVADLGVDAMSLSAHKLGGPVGIGALVVRRDLALAAPTWGGGQERGIRSGTLPMALAVGFAVALRVAVESQAEVGRRLHPWVTDFVAQTAALGGVTHNGAEAEKNGRIVNLTFDGLAADELLFLLDQQGIACSAGSACAAGVPQPSGTLLAMGRSLEQAASSVRFSFGAGTTADQVAELTQAVTAAVRKLRGES